jgi:DNA topoisomerase-1
MPAACRRSPEGDALATAGVTPEQHFTQPPPRYTEATLVKKMEELGIGRPSTYASIVTTIQDREYVSQGGWPAAPRGQGPDGHRFLMNFQRYVGYDFTAGLEEPSSTRSRPATSAGQEVLARFWREFRPRSTRRRSCASPRCWKRSTRRWPPHLFPPREDGTDPRAVPELRRGPAAA